MIKHYIFFVLCSCSTVELQAQNKPRTDALHYPELVSAFYTLIDKQNFWLSDTGTFSLRTKFMTVIDSAANWGLDANNYHNKELHRLAEISFAQNDSADAKYCELVFTDAAISFFKDLYEGSNNKAAYDELSSKYIEHHNRIILNKLVAICNGNCLEDIICSLEPENNEYFVIKTEYQKQISEHAFNEAMQLRRALQYLRWINHFKFVRYIVVNIPSASLNYYQADTIGLTMKAILGKPSTQTPGFAAYCNKVILLPGMINVIAILGKLYKMKNENADLLTD